jgi:hypothetical protein
MFEVDAIVWVILVEKKCSKITSHPFFSQWPYNFQLNDNAIHMFFCNSYMCFWKKKKVVMKFKNID